MKMTKHHQLFTSGWKVEESDFVHFFGGYDQLFVTFQVHNGRFCFGQVSEEHITGPSEPPPPQKKTIFRQKSCHYSNESGADYANQITTAPPLEFQTFPRPCRHESSRFSITPLLSYFIPHVPHTVPHSSGVRTKCAAVAAAALV